MLLLIVMGAGVLVGSCFFPEQWKKGNHVLQTVATLVIIFAMGVMLGRKENFLKDLSSLGLASFIFFVIPTVLSMLVVYSLTEKYMNKRKKQTLEKKQKQKK